MERRPDPFTLAYMAGYIDADGCVGIGSKQYPDRRGWSIFVCVSSVDPLIPTMMKVFYGGSLHRAEKASKLSKRPIWTWRVSSRKAEAALVEIAPYLRLKRPQADLALEFARTMIGGPGRPWCIPEEVATRRKEILSDMKHLNPGGRPTVGRE